MKATWASLVVVGFVYGCGGGGAAAPTDGAEAQQRLTKAAQEHSEIQNKLSSVPAADRTECETRAGDCLLLVAEGRDKLISRYRLNPCDHFPSTEAKVDCIAKQLGSGHAGSAADFYALSSWCLGKVIACTSGRAEEARLAVLEARFQSRQQQLELSPEGAAAWSSVETVHAQVQYLRSTLPADASAICEPPASINDCTTRLDGEQNALHEQLRQDAYDPAQGIADYQALKRAEVGCYEPELACLSSAMSSYGVFPESRKWVDRNLALLAQRQTLAHLVPSEVQSECLAGQQEQHQPQIVSAYAAYARQMVLYFRMQLDKTFLALHQAQVSCLASKSKAPQTNVARVASGNASRKTVIELE
jgi:hypothetical protein